MGTRHGISIAQILYCLFALIIPVFLMAGCESLISIELPFQTVEENGYSPAWREPAPGLLVVASQDEIDSVRPFVTDEALVSLGQMDFATHFALVAFRGWHSTALYDFRIREIVRTGDRVVVFANAGELSGDAAVSSPYHIVSVQKENEWGQTIVFELRFAEDRSGLVSLSHFIP